MLFSLSIIILAGLAFAWLASKLHLPYIVGMIAMLFVGLIFREAGAYLSIIHTGLNKKEELFCLVSELPKVTVQAPIGAFGMDALYDKCLHKDTIA